MTATLIVAAATLGVSLALALVIGSAVLRDILGRTLTPPDPDRKDRP